MNIWISILIIIGISLDAFATMEVEGAMAPEIKKGALAIACAITTGLSLLFFFGGYFLSFELNEHNVFSNEELTAGFISSAIFFLLGVRLIIKAIQKEFVHEKRREFGFHSYIRLVVVMSLYTLAAGLACGLIMANVYAMLVAIVICYVLVVIAGILTGYHYGFEQKTYAYATGAVLLWVVGTYVVLTEIISVL
jgi:putative Mn2+ efflux pump MntP